MSKVADDFVALIKDQAAEIGRDLGDNLEEVRQYAASRMLHLSAIIEQPGYLEAVRAERDNVALKLGLAAVAVGDAADQRLIGAIGGAIALGARALAGA
jgi:uncharacterized YccA/Bax inhibitor family protein